jgi:tetratricopeptide (TPR) repeat protein
MTPRRARSAAIFLVRAAICLAAAQCIAPHLANQLCARPRSASSQAAQSKSQKLANPLNDLLDEAQRNIDKNDFESAIPPLQRFLAEKPDVAYGHFQLAYVYTALKRTDEACAEYERTIALDPKMSEAYLNLGVLLLDKHEYAAAIVPLRKAVDLLPAQSHPRSLLAVAQDRSGDRAGAAETLQAVLRLDPKDLNAINYLGWNAMSAGKPADAEGQFRRVLEIDPHAAGALKGLAESLDAQKNPEAADAYRAYLEQAPSDSESRARLIHLLVNQEKYDDALAELDRSDAGKPPALESLKLRADIQIAQKKLDDAIATLRQALVLAPNDAHLLGGLGRVEMQKRDFPSAERELKAALQIDRNNLVYWKDLSSTYYLSGNCPSALAALDLIAKAETPGAASWFVRALCYDKLHQLRPALEAYQKFLEMDQGKNPDQVWQAQQRSKVLKHMLEEKR